MSEYKTTHHGKLKLHLERHIYKRGKYKGDAPMEARQRAKNHYRVVDRGTHMAVRFHNTDIIQAYPDGKVTIDCGGWGNSITTKTHLNGALPYGFWVASHKVFSQSQLILRTPKGRYRYYDGISFDANGAPTTPLKPFRARRIDKDEVAELNKALDENGFKEMFKVLWGAVTQEDASRANRYDARWVTAKDRTDVFSMPDLYADEWMGMVACFAFDTESGYNHDTAKWETKSIKRTPSDVWRYIMEWAKAKMYKTIETEVYELSK